MDKYDLSKSLKPYENKWVALRQEDNAVVGSGDNIAEARREAAAKGFTKVIFFQVFPFNSYYVGAL